ncbi:DUF5050 domain-containing protein [Cohnella sp. AR92]|uniref:TolB family protein n=1 Tax=Cohnella sp. AR92 TaxID=648716 RepID=UPI000F8E7D84|nr:DUF5050 domain-containing protein [Cohnella sp. AR92]RUS44598.1 DUF5050 domain-containing protein [Cohnella sp. AR92]
MEPNLSTSTKEDIYLTDLDGKRVITNDINKAIQNVWVDKNAIFYTLNKGLFKANLDGSNPQKLTESISSYQISGGWIYYNKNGSLLRLNIENANEEKVMDLPLEKSYNVNGDYVYYTDGKNILRYNIGSSIAPKELNIEETMSESYVDSIHVLPSGIYFRQHSTGFAYHLNFEGKVISMVDLGIKSGE